MTVNMIQFYITMVLFLIGLIGAIAYLKYSWKNKTSELESKTTDTWKDYAEVIEKKLSDLDSEFKEYRKAKDLEIKTLTAQVNRLEGERDALLKVKPDIEFKTTVQRILDIYNNIDGNLSNHYADDVKQFNKLFTEVKVLQEKLQKLCDKIE